MADYNKLFQLDSSNKQMQIQVEGGNVLSNNDIYGESFQLVESICTENQLKFGSCESSVVKFTIAYSPYSMKKKKINISMSINDNDPYIIGEYKVFSDIPTADRNHREIVAYDALKDIIEEDVAEWYNTVLPNNNSTVTLKQFRDSFFEHFGIEQETTTLTQDSMIVEKTIDPSELSGKDVISCICELNGCFGHIGRDGKFKYVFLKEIGKGLYPSKTLYPSKSLYPEKAKNTTDIKKEFYIGAEYEDYYFNNISKLQIRQSENDIGIVYGTGNNCYIVEDNFLVYGKSSEELEEIASRMYDVIRRVKYIPSNVTIKGNPTIEVGTPIMLETKYKTIYTYVLERELEGIQALTDYFSAEGEEIYKEDVNSANRQIIQLKGKTNEIQRTVEETKSTITDVQSGLQSQITQNASSITAEISRATGKENEINTRITATAGQIRTEISEQVQETKDYADTVSSNAETNAKADTTEKLKSYSTTTQMNSAISQSAQSITSTVNRQIQETKDYADDVASEAESNAIADTTNRLTNYSTTTQMNSAISQTADSINLSVSRQIQETKDYADDVGQDAIDAAAQDATTKANNALNSANSSTDAKLTNYSTTTQMNSAISQSAQNITSSVASTYATQTSVNQAISNLQAQIDDAVETFTGSAVPTLTNYPAVNWTTDQIKDQHIGDLYLVNSEGGEYANFYYRFEKISTGYKWSLVEDTVATQALAQANEALQLAQGLQGTLQTDYSTTTQMNSAIDQKANQITSTVSTTYETKTDATVKLNTAKNYAEGQAQSARAGANSDTDVKLASYSTTTQMNSAINQKANEITSSVSEQIEETKEYADTVASTAETNAKADTTEKLKSYSTTTQMNSAIDQKANQITSSVSEQIEETKEYADTVASTAETNAKADTANKLKSYSTTTQMNSAITQKANEITQTVSQTYETISDAEYSYSELDSKITQTENEITAEVTRATNSENNLSSRISANATSITTKVSKGDVSSEISQEADAINITSNRISISSTNFTLAADGTITAKNGNFTGSVNASSGTIGGFTIGNSLYTSQASVFGNNGVHIGNDGISLRGGASSVELKSDGSASFGISSTGSVVIKNMTNSSLNTSINYEKVKLTGTYQNAEYGYNSIVMKYPSLSKTLTIDYKSLTASDFEFVPFGTSSILKLSMKYNIIGASNGNLGFFGASLTATSTKQTVSKISSPTTATASTVATKLNDLITALNKYNLIGV